MDDHIILGIDPGTLITGYGIVKVHKGTMQVLDYGCIRTPPKFDLNDRLLIISNSTEQLIDRYSPICMSIETQYLHKNVRSTITLSMARAVVSVSAKKKGLEIHTYAPSTVKLSVVGTGKASKAQVQGMVQRRLNLSTFPPEDAADALGLVICHAQHTRLI